MPETWSRYLYLSIYHLSTYICSIISQQHIVRSFPKSTDNLFLTGSIDPITINVINVVGFTSAILLARSLHLMTVFVPILPLLLSFALNIF